uniref:DNA mismatch repair proteins mutS family domain-containing protein n=1 Tax=Odontella aurita TaxID=265563 RepID=A0A7S4HRT8_9STRA|mmetsp:Transcript_14179/g.41617  ORF Transcript_14179/g.41617 Transcript_14179/m.41617 type:complete len:993 (+) Transcript_14179:286-3264(+)
MKKPYPLVTLVACWGMKGVLSFLDVSSRDLSSSLTRLTAFPGASIDEDSIDGAFTPKLVQNVDLAPLVERVAHFSATRRGRIAFLKLIEGSSVQSVGADWRSPLRRREESRRKSIALMLDLKREKGAASTNVVTSEGGFQTYDASQLVNIAQSAADANAEYALVYEATIALGSRNREQKEECTSDSPQDDVLTAPPFYAAFSPSRNGVVESDDDDWLLDIISNERSMALEPEHILQADQVVKRLVETSDWGSKPSTQRFAPGISVIVGQIDHQYLSALHEEIKDSVQIFRVKSLSDPTGSRSYEFRLNGEMFPSLGLMRKKERDLVSDLEKTLQGLFRSKAFTSNLIGGKDLVETSDLGGRIVVPVKRRKSADAIGIVRGFAEKGGACYVEPKAMVQKGDELSELRAEIENQEKEILQHLGSLVISAAPIIEVGMQSIGRIDTIFARAAYGRMALSSVIPHIGEEGRISVKGFVHPVLAENQQESTKLLHDVVPIDLRLDEVCRSLVISGPNGGGKTVAMKAFGLAAAMSKVAIPVAVDNKNQQARVDFFGNIFVEVGDQQSVSGGESTLISRLNSCSSVIQILSSIESFKSEHDGSPSNCLGSHTLILLDELGGGTDPEAGSAISQAILENILEHKGARTVCTTHAPQLKALSFNDDKFHCASMLLDIDHESGNDYKLPTFQLAYGSIGDSYAFGAASRCAPALPDGVLKRASDILSGGEEGSGDIMRAISSSLERERMAAKSSALEAETFRKDTLKCRGAMISLAKAYEQHLARLEVRIDAIYKDLREDETRNAYELVGDTLAELRHVKKRIKSEQDLLTERGLKMVPIDYEFTEGETVVIIAKGEWDGQTGVVSSVESSPVPSMRDNVLMVTPSVDWGDHIYENRVTLKDVPPSITLPLKRSDVALWNYPDYDWGDSEPSKATKSISATKQEFFSVLSSLKADDKLQSEHPPSRNAGESSFKSSRERKAASASAKKDRKKGGKKKRKKK